ncbi:hypothetical protein VTO42DRAFT_1389 [Malbranchea cinnamomea]
MTVQRDLRPRMNPDKQLALELLNTAGDETEERRNREEAVDRIPTTGTITKKRKRSRPMTHAKKLTKRPRKKRRLSSDTESSVSFLGTDVELDTEPEDAQGESDIDPRSRRRTLRPRERTPISSRLRRRTHTLGRARTSPHPQEDVFDIPVTPLKRRTGDKETPQRPNIEFFYSSDSEGVSTGSSAATETSPQKGGNVVPAIDNASQVEKPPEKKGKANAQGIEPSQEDTTTSHDQFYQPTVAAEKTVPEPEGHTTVRLSQEDVVSQQQSYQATSEERVQLIVRTGGDKGDTEDLRLQPTFFAEAGQMEHEQYPTTDNDWQSADGHEERMVKEDNGDGRDAEKGDVAKERDRPQSHEHENEDVVSDRGTDNADAQGVSVELNQVAEDERMQQISQNRDDEEESPAEDEMSSADDSESEEESVDDSGFLQFLESNSVFGQERTWRELVEEARELLKKAHHHIGCLSSSLHELLASIQRASEAFEESVSSEKYSEPSEDLVPDVARKMSTVLSDLCPLAEEELALMSPGVKSRRQKRLWRHIRALQTYVIPCMVQMVVAAMAVYHHLDSRQESPGALPKMRELLRLLSCLCDEVEPSRYEGEYGGFRDRLKLLRVQARLLYYVYDNEVYKRQPSSDTRPLWSLKENTKATAAASQPSPSPSVSPEFPPRRPSPQKRRPGEDEERRTVSNGQPQQPREETANANVAPSQLTLSPSVSPERPPRPASPPKGRPWTNTEREALLRGLRKYQGGRRYIDIRREYSALFAGRSLRELREQACEIKRRYIEGMKVRGEPLLNTRKAAWLLSVD